MTSLDLIQHMADGKENPGCVSIANIFCFLLY